ncbi:hypothetical protein [Tellurirhabdus rosea]|uniref:hypothetical protein n=1 Tax=Tellurirhabdus rosea TaxID=2674997 RepID=UPI002251E686|nr:hypothetical protein [Tellurirhabdus rosea]
MGLFDFIKKSDLTEPASIATPGPYKEYPTNVLYELLFSDNPHLYQTVIQQPHAYPFSVLLSEKSTLEDFQKVIDDPSADPRLRALAYYRQRKAGHTPTRKELLAVIVEVGLDEGLDVLASFSNGHARYINFTGRTLIWEKTDEPSGQLTRKLFTQSWQIIQQIGPWENDRKPHPAQGTTRISFLVSDGLYFGEAPTSVLFTDALAGPALATATRLMQHLVQQPLPPIH